MPLRLALVKLRCQFPCIGRGETSYRVRWLVERYFLPRARRYLLALSQGRPNPLGELPVQYADYSLWQREWLQGEVLERQLAYWKEQLKNIPVLELAMDRRRDGSLNRAGAKQSVTLSKSLADRLKALSRQEAPRYS